MSNSTTLLDTIAANQAAKEIVMNALADAFSPASLWGRHASACNGLAWGYYGGNYQIGLTSNAVANGTVTLTASATNYLYADPNTGAVSINTTGVPTGKIPLYSIVTGSTSVTSFTDLRSFQPSATPPVSAIGVYDIGIYVEGLTSNSEVVWEFVAPRGWTLPAGASGAAVAQAAATASTTYTISKNGASIGTIAWAASGTVGTISVTSSTSFAPGDILSLAGPATADATLANIAVTLAGTRP